MQAVHLLKPACIPLFAHLSQQESKSGTVARDLFGWSNRYDGHKKTGEKHLLSGLVGVLVCAAGGLLADEPPADFRRSSFRSSRYTVFILLPAARVAQSEGAL
jgi:hypothetical protein